MEVAKKVCQEMLKQRLWKIETVDDMTISGQTDKFDSFEIFFMEAAKLNIANVKDCIKILEEHDTKHCIIIYNNNITSSAKRVITNFVDTVFELFTINELQFNITKHYLVPPHTILKEAEAVEFVKKFGMNIPILHKTDPVCRFYNFQRASIIKVDRKDKSVSYRIVK